MICSEAASCTHKKCPHIRDHEGACTIQSHCYFRGITVHCVEGSEPKQVVKMAEVEEKP